VELRGSVQKRPLGALGWLEPGSSEVQVREAGRPVGNQNGVHVASTGPKSRPGRSQSVRSSEEVP
jgi:hypothetical protein